MTGPYRTAEAPRVARIVRRAVEKPASRVRAVRFSDGSSRLRIRARVPLGLAIPLGVFAGLMILAALPYLLMTIGGEAEERAGNFYLFAIFSTVALASLRPWLRAEIIAVTRAAVIRKRRFAPWQRADVALLPDVTTVVFSGEGESARLDLQIGRRRLELAQGLGRSEQDLQRIARALRRSLDDARSR